MLLRIVVLAALVAVLAFTGVIDLGGLPWHNRDFQASGSAVLIYMLWSVAENRRGSQTLSISQMGLYAVLLVSAVDSLLLRLTVFNGCYLLRFVGSGILALGCILRLVAIRLGNITMLRTGRIMQLLGLSAGLGSIAGIIVGAVPGTISALREELPESGTDE